MMKCVTFNLISDIFKNRISAMKKQESFSYNNLFQSLKENSEPQTDESQYLSKYNQFFSHLVDKCGYNCTSSADNLHKYGIKYNPELPYLPFKAFIQKNSKNLQIVVLSVIWGHFTQKISIINFRHENDRTNRPNQIHYNANTTLYEKIIQGESVMFKSQILLANYRSSIILTTIKEIFVAKIGSALGFGPYCHMETFFDLFIYDNCIEFGMEKCLVFQDCSFGAQSQEELKECLSIMHFFKIVHFDIKPANIMFSKHFNKFVLIDFNLSDVSNHQLGKKYQIPFRGTVNYCCPEMVHNFLASENELKKVDPYYNDLFCLLQSVKFMNVEKRRIDGSVRLEYLCDLIDEDQEESAILFIKKMMYFEEWTKVYQFFSQSIFNQRFFKSLIEFLYELDLTDSLQIFYNTFVPSQLKETFLTKQFEYLLRKKWIVNLDNISMMTEKKVQYTNRFDFTQVNQISILKFDKAQALQYLNNYEKFTSSKILYYNIFLEYVSFSSNKFRVDYDSRRIAAKKCINFITEKQNNPMEIISDQFLDMQKKNQTLIRAIMMIIQEIFVINHEKKDSDDSIVNNMLLQLLPFIIILDIGTLEQNLLWYERMLQILKSDLDKLCFLLSLKQLNSWSQDKIGKKGTYSRFVACQKTKQFAILGLRNFNRNCQKQFEKIIQFTLRTNINTSDSMSFNYEGSHHTLQRLVKKQNFQRYLQIQNTSIEKICKLTQTEIIKGHISFEPFYFSLYQRCRAIGRIDFCRNIISIYQLNLNDSELQRKFNIYYKSVIRFGTNKQCLFKQIEKIETYLNQIEDQDIGLSVPLILWISGFEEIFNHNREELTFQEHYILCKRHETIHFKLMHLLQKYYTYKTQRKDTKVHECFNPKHQINLYLYSIDRIQTFLQCQIFLKKLTLMDQYNKCCHCMFAIDCFIIICQQSWVVTRHPNNSLQIFASLEEQLHKLNARISTGHYSYQNCVYFRQVMIHMTINYAVFCTYGKTYQIKHKGLRNLYQMMKQQIKRSNDSLMWIYFGNLQTNQLLLQYTMRILFQEEFQQFINFLVILSRHLDKNLEMSSFNLVLLCFTKLLIHIDFHQQLAIYESLRRQIETRPQIKNHQTIYFYCLAMTIKNTVKQEILYFRIAPTLANFPFDLQAFFSSAIYLHFAKKLRGQDSKSQRRQLYINNKLVKLMLRKWESKIEKGKKYPACKNIYMKLLVNKLKKIDGPISTIMDTTWKYVYSMKYIT